jgi:pimeloyl-ACP methyl ester carboxylesterase
MARDSFATVAGLKTHYIEAGDGPVLLMLHSQSPGACAEVDWGENIEYFARAGFKVYALDQAGFGLTENPDDHSVERRTGHVRAFVDLLAPKRYSMWGASMGSYIAASIALDDPRVDKLIFMPSNVLPPPAPQGPSPEAREHAAILHSYTPSPSNARMLLEASFYDPGRVDDTLVDLYCRMSSGKNAEAETARRRLPRPPALYDELKDLRAPTLLLWGLDDLGATPERAVLLLRCIPGGELVLLPRAKHSPQRDRPDRANQVVHDFLR